MSLVGHHTIKLHPTLLLPQENWIPFLNFKGPMRDLFSIVMSFNLQLRYLVLQAFSTYLDYNELYFKYKANKSTKEK